MKTIIVILISVLFSIGGFGQCKFPSENFKQPGYETIKTLEIKMEEFSDTLQKFSFILNSDNEYRLFFAEANEYAGKAKIDLYADSKLIGTNYIKESEKLVSYFDFKCQKTQVYTINITKKTTEEYCGLCVIMQKEDNSEIKTEQSNTGTTNNDQVFVVVDKMPEFKAGKGLDSFSEWIGQNMIYPEEAAKKGISGKVYIQFQVNSNGEVENAKVVRSVDPDLDKEAVRVVNSSPVWEKPGMQRGKAVNVQYTVQIIFQLQ
ncbi:MAG: energy transducer TonB [Bacteroidales bacterium]|nr:energy transducer TonB [Bacteroidales bacterium]MBN2818171.1 energy transducer TonB [Bacteroidales bacterium]